MHYTRPDIRRQDAKKDKSSPGGALLKGLIVGLLSEFLLALMLTAVLFGTQDPARLLTAFACVAQITGAVIGSCVCSLCDRSRSVYNCALLGVAYAAVALLFSLFFPKGGGSLDVLRAVLVLSGCAAASLATGFILRRRQARIGVGDKNPAALARRRLGRQ